jgi:hypothetical protein
MVQFNGHFDGQVITPDERVEIPTNVPLRVFIEPLAAGSDAEVKWSGLIDIATQCSIEGPVDLAEQHDHYAHGKPVE